MNKYYDEGPGWEIFPTTDGDYRINVYTTLLAKRLNKLLKYYESPDWGDEPEVTFRFKASELGRVAKAVKAKQNWNM